MGAADAFLVVGQIEFFYDQAPESTKSLGTAMSLTAYGSAILSLMERAAAATHGSHSWVANDLNASKRCANFFCFGLEGCANWEPKQTMCYTWREKVH
ncbi:hypothetical protein ACP4OV_027301 [Aristida adscensionis]